MISGGHLTHSVHISVLSSRSTSMKTRNSGYLMDELCCIWAVYEADGISIAGCTEPMLTKISYDIGFPSGSDGKVPACNAGDLGSIPGWGRSPGEGNGNPLYYSCLENPVDGGTWWATVHGVTNSRTRLSDFTFTFSDDISVRFHCTL